MATILHIETATDLCSICISKEGEKLVLVENKETFSHAASITLLIEEATKKAGIKLSELDAVSLSQGPGSYTALRIGTSTAKGICYALDKPLIAINTLQALAWASYQEIKEEEALYFPMIDARRMEVYTAGFNAKQEMLVDVQAKIIDKNAFQEYFEKDKKLIFAGNGAPKCQSVISSPNANFIPIICEASHLVSLAEKAFNKKDFQDVAYFSPLYFKAPNITTPKKVL